MLNDPDYVKGAGDLPERRPAHQLHLQLVLRRLHAHRVLQQRRQPGARGRRRPRSSRSGREPAYEWRDWNPTTNTADYTPASPHPNSIDQDYYISWNNKQAKDYATAACGNGSVHRGNLLDDRVKELVAAGGVTRASLTKAMADAALADLRAEDVAARPAEGASTASRSPTPRPPRRSPSCRPGVAAGSQAHGDHRRFARPTPRRRDPHPGRLVAAAGRRPSSNPASATTCTPPSPPTCPSTSPRRPRHGPTGAHAGSSFQYGWWGYVDKDLRAVLGEPVQGPLAQPYCGGGSLSACRDAC